MEWNTPVRFVPLIGPKLASLFERLEIHTAGDLLLHLPFRYEDYSYITTIAKLQDGETTTIKGKVRESKNEYRRSKFNLQKVVISDGTGELMVTWFNQPYLIKFLPENTQIALSGKVERFGRYLQMQNPEYEVIQNDKPLIHTGRLIPVYPETAGISSKRLRNRVRCLLDTELTNEYLPKDLIQKYQLLSFNDALERVHFPDSLAEVGKARERLAFDELFILSLRSQLQRNKWNKQKIRQPFVVNQPKLNQFISKLPFMLTSAQKRTVDEIISDLKKPTPMNRLVEGDVGSGKTVVAAIAIYITHLNKQQSLFMSPTEILAQQHVESLTQLLSSVGIKVGMQTGSKKDILLDGNRQKAGKKQKSPKFDVVIGTHALLEKHVQLDHIGLVIIDEQHRFGVRQRALLREKGDLPHVLTMTATPIPRTMALTVYGDLDLSVIDEMPVGRIPIKTWVVPPAKRQGAYEWMQSQLSFPQRQAFIICPFIEPSESLTTVKAVKEEHARLQRDIFPKLKLGLLHGRMSSGEKDRILEQFRDGKFHILVSTPVVEVGIDIPTATIMLIEAAERFGLSQLHQLRGRVGRGKEQSYCLLFTSDGTTETQRLKAMEYTNSGLKLAEMDMRIRGSGQIYGTAQHGRSFLKIADKAPVELFEQAQLAAESLYVVDPELNSSPALKERVVSGTIVGVAQD